MKDRSSCFSNGGCDFSFVGCRFVFQIDLRAEAKGVRRIETLNRTNNEISWLLRELYFETF